MLEIKNLKKSYDGNIILQDINLNIEEGEIVSILGPSGCGKTTLLNLILGLTGADEGEIIFNGEVITDMPMEQRGFNIVFQDYALFPNLNVYRNITYGLKNNPKISTPQEVEELIDLLGLREHLHKKIEQLSGGQKQRVAIAGVMAMRPRCIILDEPTAMLDPNGRKEVLEAVRELNRKEKVTVILITHYMEEVIHADRVYVMDSGNVVMQGNPKEIFSQVDTLKAYGLDVPQVTLLAYELKKSGVDVPDGILITEELVSALCQSN